MASYSKVVGEWPFRETNGAERIYTAVVKVDVQFDMHFAVIYRSKWAMSSNNNL